MHIKYLEKYRHSQVACSLSFPVYMRLYPYKYIFTYTYTKINMLLYNLETLSVMKHVIFSQSIFINVNRL